MDTIVRSPFPSVYIPDISVTRFVTENCDAFSERIALVDLGKGKSYTYKEFKQSIIKFASGLSRIGIAKGQVICVFSHNSADYLIFLYAALSLGAQVTLANALYVTDELVHHLSLTRASYIYTTATQIDRVREAVKKYGRIKKIFTSEEIPGCTSLTALQAMASQSSTLMETIVMPKRDTAVIPFSSGSTGKPKGVVLSHSNLVSSCAILRNPAIFRRNPTQGAHVLFQPFSHIYAMMLYTTCLSIGEKVIIIPRFNLQIYLKAVSEHKAERLWIVPPIAILMAKSPLMQKYDLSKVKDIVSGAAPLGEDLEKQVLSKLNPQTTWLQAYGMTENAGITHLIPRGLSLQGSVGCVVNNTEVKVVDPETGKSLGPGQPGELLIRGPQVMQGYLDDQTATMETLTPDKWQHTGDVGYYTEEGYFYIVDRIKELIKYKGYQVAPAELEALLLGYPAVADVCVVGIQDQEAGEVPRAYIVKKLGYERVSPSDIEDFLTDKVAPYKKLRGGVRFVKQIPKSPSGKLLRRLIRDEANRELGKSRL